MAAVAQAGWMKVHSVRGGGGLRGCTCASGAKRRAADRVHPRSVAKPSVLGKAVRKRPPGRSSGSWHTTFAVTACPRPRSRPSTTSTPGSGPTMSRRSSISSGSTRWCWSAGRTAPSSSATTCARTARIESAPSSSSAAPSSSARRRSGRCSAPEFLDHFADATAEDLPTNIRAMRGLVRPSATPLPAADVGTLLCASMAVPAQVRANLGARDVDCDDVLRALEVPLLVTHGVDDTVVLPRWPSTSSRHCPTAEASWYEGVAPRAPPGEARALYRTGRPDPTGPRA